MGGEILKDEEGKEHYIFDQSELYDDEKMGEKLEDFEILTKDSDSKSVHSFINQKIYMMKSYNFKEQNKDVLINQINAFLEFLICQYLLPFFQP